MPGSAVWTYRERGRNLRGLQPLLVTEICIISFEQRMGKQNNPLNVLGLLESRSFHLRVNFNEQNITCSLQKGQLLDSGRRPTCLRRAQGALMGFRYTEWCWTRHLALLMKFPYFWIKLKPSADNQWQLCPHPSVSPFWDFPVFADHQGRNKT